MIFPLEIQEDDLAFLVKEMPNFNISFVLNRWSDADSARCSRLRTLGIIEKCPYYGESMCYNPSYRLTELGKMVFEQYKEKQNVTT